MPTRKPTIMYVRTTGRPVSNKYKVPLKQWRQWSNHGRAVFNRMYHSLRPSRQFVFLHPAQVVSPKKFWQTTRWNVAWEAACAAEGGSHAAMVTRK